MEVFGHTCPADQDVRSWHMATFSLLAQMTGTTLHTVSRILSGWEQAGLIESGRQRIVLREPHKIFVLAEQTPGQD
jgi:CRP-like cAMP-binding protein